MRIYRLKTRHPTGNIKFSPKPKSKTMTDPTIARVIDTHNGHAIVSSFCVYHGRDGLESCSKDPDHYTGHVWAEIQCGMGVNRINVTPSEARRIAAMLIEVADAMDPEGAK